MRKWNIVNLLNNDSYSYAIGNIVSDSDFRNTIKFRYASWSFPTSEYLDDNQEAKEIAETKAEAYAFFKLLFNEWKTRRLPEFVKMSDALTAEYNPIENYNRIEEGSITDAHHKGSKSTATLTPNTTTTSTNTINGFDGGSVTGGSNTVNQTGSSTSTSTNEDISATVFDKDVKSFQEYRIHGNIGVTTNQQMIEAELEMRKTDLITNIVEEFVRMYLIL